MPRRLIYRMPVCLSAGLGNGRNSRSPRVTDRPFQDFIIAQGLFHRMGTVEVVELGELVVQCRKVPWKDVRRALGSGCAYTLICWLFAVMVGLIVGIFLALLVASMEHFLLVLLGSWLVCVPGTCWLCNKLMATQKIAYERTKLTLFERGLQLTDWVSLGGKNVRAIPFEQIDQVFLGEQSVAARTAVEASKPLLQLAGLIGAPLGAGRLASKAAFVQRNRLSVVLRDGSIQRLENVGLFFDHHDLAILLEGINNYLVSQKYREGAVP